MLNEGMNVFSKPLHCRAVGNCLLHTASNKKVRPKKDLTINQSRSSSLKDFISLSFSHTGHLSLFMWTTVQGKNFPFPAIWVVLTHLRTGKKWKTEMMNSYPGSPSKDKFSTFNNPFEL